MGMIRDGLKVTKLILRLHIDQGLDSCSTNAACLPNISQYFNLLREN